MRNFGASATTMRSRDVAPIAEWPRQVTRCPRPPPACSGGSHSSSGELDDWELFLALHRLHPRWDGLITNDDTLLAQPKEMTVLSQTHLTLVVAKGARARSR